MSIPERYKFISLFPFRELNNTTFCKTELILFCVFPPEHWGVITSRDSYWHCQARVEYLCAQVYSAQFLWRCHLEDWGAYLHVEHLWGCGFPGKRKVGRKQGGKNMSWMVETLLRSFTERIPVLTCLCSSNWWKDLKWKKKLWTLTGMSHQWRMEVLGICCAVKRKELF